MKRTFAGILASVLIIILAGCGGISIRLKTGKISFTNDGFKIEGFDGSTGTFKTDNDGGLVVETEEGELRFGEDLDLPSGYPDDILPLYEVDSITTTSSADNAHYVAYVSKASLKECTDYYKGLMEGAEDNTATTSDAGSIIGGKINGWQCVVQIMPEGSDSSKTNVILALEKK